MMYGLGTDTTTPMPPVAAPAPGFVDGIKLWETPSAAISAVSGVVSNASTAFSGDALPYTLGVLTVPAVLLMVLMGGKGR